MASSTKRRKAARKKKKEEMESQITSNLHENGDLISENEKDSSDGSVQNDSATSEDLKSGESRSPLFESINKPPDSDAVAQSVGEVEAGDDLQIERRDVEEAVGDETDGQGSELKSNGVLTVKVVKKEETSASIYLERFESTKESCNGESDSLHMVNSAEKPPEGQMTPRVARRTSWMNCCGLLDAITESRT